MRLKKKKIISIQKTRDLYYYQQVNSSYLNKISHPKKIDLDNFSAKNCTVIAPKELKNDRFFNKIKVKK